MVAVIPFLFDLSIGSWISFLFDWDLRGVLRFAFVHDASFVHDDQDQKRNFPSPHTRTHHTRAFFTHTCGMLGREGT